MVNQKQQLEQKSSTSPARKKVARDLSSLSKGDAVAFLMDKYGQGVELRGTTKPLRNATYDWNDGSPYLLWSYSQPLACLLHEIGHHRLRHDRLPVDAKGVVHIDEIAEEAAAWLWAEERARRHEVAFPYGLAEKWFETYCKGRRKKGIVLINWRYHGISVAS